MFIYFQLYFTPILFSILSLIYSSINNNHIEFGAMNDKDTGKFTDKETSALQKLRPSIKDVLKKDYEQNDDFLIRWLRASNLDVDEANQMLRQAQTWREKNNIDSILNETIAIHGAHSPCLDVGLDYKGSPVNIIRSGGISTRRLLLAGESNKVLRLATQCLERSFQKIRQASISTGKNVTQAVCIIDFTGYSMTQHACWTCIQTYLEILRVFGKYYPGLTKLIVLINVPKVAKAALDAYLPIIPQEYRKVPLKIFGINSRNELVSFLLKMMPANQLPYEYGGTKKL